MSVAQRLAVTISACLLIRSYLINRRQPSRHKQLNRHIIFLPPPDPDGHSPVPRSADAQQPIYLDLASKFSAPP